eukprot:NODE_237_length_1823_cov_77.860259_g212_i0.p1 GENE.NODE_237_length_1823_cov_77.860259_g212_i0~~NODE_237_length_1823_cov_77.860259_g212_i0.p1  ORF type:complete len:343 (+),score=30.04 NODE_237_length_1823_cov_77.860259_g212_i0:210-1238(+)
MRLRNAQPRSRAPPVNWWVPIGPRDSPTLTQFVDDNVSLSSSESEGQQSEEMSAEYAGLFLEKETFPWSPERQLELQRFEQLKLKLNEHHDDLDTAVSSNPLVLGFNRKLPARKPSAPLAPTQPADDQSEKQDIAEETELPPPTIGILPESGSGSLTESTMSASTPRNVVPRSPHQGKSPRDRVRGMLWGITAALNFRRASLYPRHQSVAPADIGEDPWEVEFNNTLLGYEKKLQLQATSYDKLTDSEHDGRVLPATVEYKQKHPLSEIRLIPWNELPVELRSAARDQDLQVDLRVALTTEFMEKSPESPRTEGPNCGTFADFMQYANTSTANQRGRRRGNV